MTAPNIFLKMYGGSLMRKLVAAVLGLFIMTFATVCFAETYEMVYEAKNFTEGLKNDEALSETFLHHILDNIF